RAGAAGGRLAAGPRADGRLAAGRVAGAEVSVPLALGVTAGTARLALRRCGRRRGRAPSTSEGRCSLTAAHDGAPWRWPSARPDATRLLGKSEQELKPPLPSRVYIQYAERARREGRSEPLRTGLDTGAGRVNRTLPSRAPQQCQDR